MRLLICRHGATSSNEAHRYLGLTDEPLSATGRTQCMRAGVFPQVQRVYVSRLARARESAQICFPQADLIEVAGLEEFDFGAFEGRSAAEMYDDSVYRAWVDGGCTGACPGGDSRAGYVARVCAAFEGLVHEAFQRGEERLVIVAHGGTIMAIFSAFADSQCEGFAGYDDYFCWQVAPAEGLEARVCLEGSSLRIEGVRRWAGTLE